MAIWFLENGLKSCLGIYLFFKVGRLVNRLYNRLLIAKSPEIMIVDGLFWREN